MPCVVRFFRWAGVALAVAVSTAAAIIITARVVRPGVIDSVSTEALLGLLLLVSAPVLTFALIRLDRSVAKREAGRRRGTTHPEPAAHANANVQTAAIAAAPLEAAPVPSETTDITEPADQAVLRHGPHRARTRPAPAPVTGPRSLQRDRHHDVHEV